MKRSETHRNEGRSTRINDGVFRVASHNLPDFGISAADDLLLIEDFVLVRQHCSVITVAFDDIEPLPSNAVPNEAIPAKPAPPVRPGRTITVQGLDNDFRGSTTVLPDNQVIHHKEPP